MEIKASQVKELRDMTGVAMMECKKALVECSGDIEKALDLLRSNSALKAEKKATRVAADGVLRVYVGENYSTLIEINSETDFAASFTDARIISITGTNGKTTLTTFLTHLWNVNGMPAIAAGNIGTSRRGGGVTTSADGFGSGRKADCIG